LEIFGKVIGINLAVVLVYSALIRLLSGHAGGGGSGWDIMGASAIAVGLHTFICLVISLASFGSRDKETGRVWLGTTAIVLVVGFSVCVGNTSLG
jgi:hypothetical protein